MATVDSSNQGGQAPAPAGWYPTETGQRYWDGSQWLANPPPGPMGAQNPPGPMSPQGQGAPFQVAPHPSGISAEDRQMGMLVHLLGLVAGILAPLIFFFTKGKESAFVRHHAAEALNLAITLLVVLFGSIAVLFGGTGIIALISTSAAAGVFFAAYFLFFILMFGASIASLVFTIMAGMAANRGEWYRIPFCFRWVK